MDREKKYWNEQLKVYSNLNYDTNIKYYEWQPARWAGNYVAIELMKNKIKNISSICEVGAGSGAFSISLYNYNNKIKITAVDNSKAAVKFGRRIFKDLNVPVKYIYDDLFNINGKYDMVLSLGVIEHYESKKMIRFVKKCIELTNKYILISIPNQDSDIFKNYVSWSDNNSKKYEEKHKKFNTDDLVKLLKSMDLDILCIDGFQVFLSSQDFLTHDTKNNLEIIRILKNNLSNYDQKLADAFPNVNFINKNIKSMVSAELDLDKKTRMKYSFMTFVLAKIK